MTQQISDIKVVVGLGNPGLNYFYTRHNIGFRVLDELARRQGVQWHAEKNLETAQVILNDRSVRLIKPQTFMNSSGDVIPGLQRDGVKPENILVVHDELELPFGSIKFKVGGSHKGHNGLRSIIERCGADFARLRVGIGRPERREDVPDYVLKPFSEDRAKVDEIIAQAADLVANL